jgi:hypothetical protein
VVERVKITAPDRSKPLQGCGQLRAARAAAKNGDLDFPAEAVLPLITNDLTDAPSGGSDDRTEQEHFCTVQPE